MNCKANNCDTRKSHILINNCKTFSRIYLSKVSMDILSTRNVERNFVKRKNDRTRNNKKCYIYCGKESPQAGKYIES